MPSIFHRNTLCQQLVGKLLHPNALDITVRDGLFMSGIRRIGKTTFLQKDLIPALEREGALVIYVDLWSGRTKITPEQQILRAIQQSFELISGNGFSLKEVKVDMKLLSFSFQPESIGAPDGITLADAFVELISKLDRSIVLIIDEIQETIKTAAGLDFLATLKAARDAVNIRTYNDNDTYLLILGTGSHRSMVTSMATRSSQPFFGSDWIEFPPLEEDYIEWEVKRLKDASSSLMPKLPTVTALNLGFKLLGSRPKEFRQALVSIQQYHGQDRDSAFELLCRNIAKNSAFDRLEPIYQSSRLCQRLFTEIARAGAAGTKNLYSKAFIARLNQEFRPTHVGISAVQRALAKLTNLDAIYANSYGNYLVSDPLVAQVWLDESQQADDDGTVCDEELP